MRTIQLKISDDIYKEVMDFFDKFDENQLNILFDKKTTEYQDSDSENFIEETVTEYDYLSKNDSAKTEGNIPAPDDPVFLANKRYLERELETIKSGEAEFYTMEELEKATDAVIAKYENRD